MNTKHISKREAIAYVPQPKARYTQKQLYGSRTMTIIILTLLKMEHINCMHQP